MASRERVLGGELMVVVRTVFVSWCFSRIITTNIKTILKTNPKKYAQNWEHFAAHCVLIFLFFFSHQHRLHFIILTNSTTASSPTPLYRYNFVTNTKLTHRTEEVCLYLAAVPFKSESPQAASPRPSACLTLRRNAPSHCCLIYPGTSRSS